MKRSSWSFGASSMSVIRPSSAVSNTGSWGRYEKPTLDQFEDETRIEDLNSEEFEVMSVDTFLETPGAVVGEKIMPDGSVESYEGFAPIYGEGLDDYLFEDGFYQWVNSEE